MSRSKQAKRIARLQALIKTAGGEREVEHISRVFRTGTPIDVGSWFGRRRVWACVLENELLLVARGRHPHIERVPFDRLQDSLYNHVTGEVVLGPAENVKVTRLRLSPVEAVQLLRCLGVEIEERGWRITSTIRIEDRRTNL